MSLNPSGKTEKHFKETEMKNSQISFCCKSGSNFQFASYPRRKSEITLKQWLCGSFITVTVTLKQAAKRAQINKRRELNAESQQWFIQCEHGAIYSLKLNTLCANGLQITPNIKR